ncbi:MULTISPECIES: hypothetical protein [Achromobacter]|uniref:Uncharacterized protein n=1 Tax=Achromobacter xylosoxidans (strain A8) TaxID=762376 RepID=E3HYM1_ACHXA|nr:hypothetical protein [Achromobacter xylosoxidans]ADP20175.1 hypothetical protein AXYL_06893 [Achromobacter xylosoxidans A8]
MSTPHYRYLNAGLDPRMASQLAEKVREMQKRAPASQWINAIRALTQKGVKQREIEEAGIVEWLEAQGNHPVTQESILGQLALRPTIKEIDLSRPKYREYAVPGHDRYTETLYCLNSPRDNVEDRLEEIRFELEDLDFNPERLLKEPMLVHQLDEERRKLMSERDTLPDFTRHHYSDMVDPTTGSAIKNLMAHTRTTRRGGLFFIDEIQSDWAQKRRRAGDLGGVPDGPFIGHTESWAGLILRRVMQRAAEDSSITGIAWINADLRNGGRFRRDDGLDEFYLRVLPSLANKALKGTGVTVKASDVQLNAGTVHSLPYVPMTPEVRAKLRTAQPVYSMDLVPRSALALRQDMTQSDMVREAKEMLGSTMSVRLLNKVIRAVNGEEEEEVAARQLDNLIEVSVRARSAGRAFNHEAFHYAESTLMSPHEAETLRAAFVDGSPLNDRVRRAMVAAQMAPEAIAQCSDPVEAAAHAFSLWREQRFHFDERAGESTGTTGLDRTVGRIFRKIESAFQSLGQWVRRVVGERSSEQNARVSERLFEALRDGTLQRRQNDGGEKTREDVLSSNSARPAPIQLGRSPHG